jgi:lysophospholipase L1-like esterase
MIFGDSITVGYYGTVVNGINTSCYAYKVGEASGMNWLSSGRGGGSFDGFMGGTDDLGFAYEGRLWREIKKLRPDYVMVTLGTNGGGTYSQYKAVIDTIIKAGATPILNTLPIRADGDHIHNVDYVVAANATIMQIWRDYGINGARFDLATSLNNDGETINDTMFGDDYIHPNDAGHTAMYQRVLVDCPYLFLNN